MAIDKAKFLGMFLDEFRSNLVAAENQIVVLKNDGTNPDALSALLRTLHTLKGSARMLQFSRMERLAHGAESVFKGVREGRYSVDTRLARFFFAAADGLRAATDSIESGGADEIPSLDALLEACERLAAGESFDFSSLPRASSSRGAAEFAARAEGGSVLGAEVGGDALAPGTAPRDDEDRTDATIRVDSGSIDRSIALVNTLTVRQARLRAASERIDALEKELSRACREATDARTLRRDSQAVARSLRRFRGQLVDWLFEIGRGTQELREEVLSMRMLPLSETLDRFPRMVEEAAAELGKEAGLSVTGDSARLDRAVLSRISDPLIHLVRNAIDHGIETPERRRAAGKDPRGSIRIDCRAEGSRVSVSVEDDGAGLDYEAIRERAIASWPEEEAEIRKYGDDELARYLFRAGFTTRKSASALSGRGVGLDIVKTNVEAAKGQIRLESRRGRGCRFTLLLPVSSSTMDGMFVECSGMTFFVPASSIERTALVEASDLFSVGQRDMLEIDGVNVPLLELATGLKLERTERRAGRVPVLVAHGASETVAIAVDRIVGYDSLVYQPLPECLARLQVAHGTVFDPSFRIIPILNMWSVIERLRSVRAMDTRKRFAAADSQRRPSALVVDDSSTTREIEISMLDLEGFDAVGAIDGVDALEKLRAARFDLVVSDLTMPRMDGFALLENMRGDDALKETPVIIVTTVEDPAARARASELGADRFLLKSAFDQDDLVGAAKSLVAGRVAP